ncbi:uncharacterized protein LOC126368890 [Pectinophora gossypiella]|uniref:uncharacterized protein LOC126368890 n=1 Tax=Pectinophora gossypiella TaxID=13191 RepID=UPI00214E7936|nr:uncharacterized protein LOC126368890 [Pectinophora gossypiella]
MFKFLIALILSVVTANEIRLESLDDGPGVLPFKLGPTRLVTHYHSFLQYIELTKIEDRITSVRTQISNIKNILRNDTYMLYEVQLTYLISKLDKATYQLTSLEPHREKRGLVDGLGSVIKSLTGNLDYTDALKYNDAINTLKNNQDKLSSQINNHISLSKEWILHQSSVISQIANNQIKINETLHLLLDKGVYAESTLIKYAKLAQFLTIISDNVDELSNELRRIEDIIAFTRTSSTHHSMLGIDILGKMLDKLKELYNKDQLLDIELREYYDVMETGSYYTGTQIVIVFRVPIISHFSYDLYKLPIAPNRNRQVLIPPYPLIATNGESYVYIEAECPKLSTRYLCKEKVNQQIRTGPDCIQKLITDQTLDDSCRKTTITLLKETIEKLDDRHYVVVLPRPTKVQLTCERDEFRTLDGSYLVNIPYHCSLRTTELTIYNSNDRVEGQPIKILNIPIDIQTNSATQPPITLGSINLDELRDIQDKIISQTPTQLDNLSTLSLYHTTIPLYVVMLSAVVLIAIILYQKYAKCSQTPNNRRDPAHTYEDPENTSAPHPDTTKRAATFSLNILK